MRWMTPLAQPNVPGCPWLDGVTSVVRSRKRILEENNLSVSGSLIQIYSAACAVVLRKCPSAQLLVLPLTVHQRNCTTIKGNKAEKEAVCRVSGDRKEFPAAGAGRQFVKRLSILASVLGNFAFFFYDVLFLYICCFFWNSFFYLLRSAVWVSLEQHFSACFPLLFCNSFFYLPPFLLHVSMGILSTRVLLTSSRIPAMGIRGQPFRFKFVSLWTCCACMHLCVCAHDRYTSNDYYIWQHVVEASHYVAVLRY